MFMIIFKYLLVALLGFLFIGCSTKYQPVGFSGGFSETRLGDDTFNVSFRGNGYTSREKASDFALLRSAELTLDGGYQYFIILNSEKYVENGSYTSPKTYNTTFQANTFGNQTYGNAYTRSNGGNTIYFQRPSTDNTIQCFKDKPNLNTVIYEAEFISKSIKTKYDIRD
jgi:hypothetical protein